MIKAEASKTPKLTMSERRLNSPQEKQKDLWKNHSGSRIASWLNGTTSTLLPQSPRRQVLLREENPWLLVSTNIKEYQRDINCYSGPDISTETLELSLHWMIFSDKYSWDLLAALMPSSWLRLRTCGVIRWVPELDRPCAYDSKWSIHSKGSSPEAAQIGGDFSSYSGAVARD